MNKQEYLLYLEKEIMAVLDDYHLNNYKKQIFAWKLNADFNRTYKESYLWNRSLFLSTNACILLKENQNKKLAINALKESAEILEYLSEISEDYDKHYLLVLSALCYDLAGYQANAYCLTNKLDEYKFNTDDAYINLVPDNFIVEQIRLVLLKKIPLANHLLDKLDQDDLGLTLFNNAIKKWYSYILNLDEADFLKELHNAYQFYLNTANTYISHLIFLLEARLLLFRERSIWDNLKQIDPISKNLHWQKYIKLLSHDIYDINRIKNIERRISKFEFWISQLRAVEKGFLDSENNYVIQMPTSAGKTFIAELSILNYLIKFPQKKCIYVAPFRALISEKENDISQYFSKLGFSVSAITGSYEIDEFQDVIIEETDVLIATPEKIDLLLRLNPDFFNNVSLIVIDEGQIIGDINQRASLLEFLIIRLRIKIQNLKTLFISAVMPPQNANEYALWLSGNESNVLRSLLFKDSNVNEEWEPTRKLIASFAWNGNRGRITFQNVITEDEKTRESQGAFIPSFLVAKEFGDECPKKGNKPETAAALAYKLSSEGNTLVFCAQVPRIKSVAKPLLRIIDIMKTKSIPSWFVEDKDKESYYYSNIWYGSNSYVTKAIKSGIGIHYGSMPEQVRSAVENDFRNGKLRVLLATNTVGQGINFPIKNLIFYSIIIGWDTKNNRPNYIQKRDFWNIVGRAGRAGEETEGKVIFVINSDNDSLLYNVYTNKENIEDANSLLYNVLDAMINSRINAEKFDEYIALLSEPYLLDLITEEIIGTEDEKIIEEMIDNSLFKIQIDKREIDIEPIRTSFKKIHKKFREQASQEQLEVYGKTGFSFTSSKIIDGFIEQNKDELEIIIKDDDYFQLLSLFLRLIEQNSFSELESYKLKKIDLAPSSCFDIIKLWIEGKDTRKLQGEWSKLNIDLEQLNIFISEALYYLYPWALTTFLTILSYKLRIEIKDFSEGIKNLTSFVKFGLNNSTACLARSLGIKGRNTSLLLSKKSNGLAGKEFIRWLANLIIEEINNFKISKFDKKNIQDISLKLTPNSFREVPSLFSFYIKGIYYDENRRRISKLIKIGDKLLCERDYKNKYDPYAIRILLDKNEVGYVPREFAKIVSSEIDLNRTSYDITVKKLEALKEYKRIYVEMIKRT